MTNPRLLSDLTIIIPSLNAGKKLSQLLEQLRTFDTGLQIIVVDGGSTDHSEEVAKAYAAVFIKSKPGRGIQLKNACEKWQCEKWQTEWALILHADSQLPLNWFESVSKHVSDPTSHVKAGYFGLRFDDHHFFARFIESMVVLRCFMLRLPYGDQGLLISEQLYRSSGGYRELPFLEDLEFIGRIGFQKLSKLKGVITTSAEKYQRHGYFRQSSRNLAILLLFLVGVKIERLIKWFG